ncbi:MAG: sigma-54-dependent transcriptional regulator [Phocaeicola sp.]
MRKKRSILIIDDNKTILQTLQLLLQKEFTTIQCLSSPVGIEEAMRSNRFDVVLLDMNFRTGINNGNEGLYWLQRIKQLAKDTPVVLFTAYADIALAVEGMKLGAADFITKPWENDKLLATLLHAASTSQKRGKEPLTPSRPIYWGETARMQQLRAMVEKVALTDANIFITGENGTGKELLAREIHQLSPRAEQLMIAVDMGAIPENLFESELFGYTKGAFTDARSDKKGKFEAAHEGTLFLDEIANLPLHQQAKLLTALQSRSVTPVGGLEAKAVNIRLIVATNGDLPKMVQAGDFREDLFYRIHTIHLVLPPLRERKADIKALALCFLEKYGSKYGKSSILLSDEAVALLESYSWPGNIRELEHAIEKAVIMSGGDTLLPTAFQLKESCEATQSPATPTTLEDMEHTMIVQAIQACEGNLSTTAARLGISRQTLYNKMKRYNL